MSKHLSVIEELAQLKAEYASRMSAIQDRTAYWWRRNESCSIQACHRGQAFKTHCREQ